MILLRLKPRKIYIISQAVQENSTKKLHNSKHQQLVINKLLVTLMHTVF